MRFHQLRYFLAVAQTHHFTRAAEQVGVAQPSLSKQINALEATLGAALFDRGHGTVNLTPAGEALLPLARSILADVETAHLQVQQLVGLRRGRVRLGAPPSLCTSLVADVLRAYRDSYPNIELFVEENGSQDLASDLVRGDLDLALIVLDHHADTSLRAEPLLRESLVVASAPRLPSELPARLEVDDLRDYPFVMFRAGYDLRETTLDLCAQAGFTPRFAIEGGEMDAVLSFVEAGLGIAVVPSTALPARSRLRATELVSAAAYRTVALAQRHEVAPTHAAVALRHTVLAWLREASTSLPAGVTPIHPTEGSQDDHQDNHQDNPQDNPRNEPGGR